MKHFTHLRLLGVLLLMLCGVTGAWAEDVTKTYTFTSKSWAANDEANTAANWKSIADGNAMDSNGKGVGVQKAQTGACANSPVAFTNVSKVVVVWGTSSNGVGDVNIATVNTENAALSTSTNVATVTVAKNKSNQELTWEPSTPYNGYIQFYVNCTTSTIYIKSVSITYTPTLSTDVSAPAISPNGGIFTSPQTVTLSADEGTTIMYTTDGTNPSYENEVGEFYEEPFTISSSCTVKAIAVDDDGNESSVASANFTIKKSIANTQATAYTVAQAKALIDDPDSNLEEEVYVKGKICKIDSYNSTYNSITYWISADGTQTDMFEVYSGRDLNNADFSSADDIELGANVVVYGKIQKYKTTYEFNSGNYLAQYTAPAKCSITWSVNGVTTTEEQLQGTTISLPDAPTAKGGKVFMGWSNSSSVNADGSDFTPFATDALVPSENAVTYYAVFATESGSTPVNKTIYYEPFTGAAHSNGFGEDNVAATQDMFYDKTATVFSHYSNITAASTTSYATNLDGDGMSNGIKIFKEKVNNTSVVLFEVTGIDIQNASNLSVSLYNRRSHTSAILKVQYKIDNGGYQTVGGEMQYNSMNDKWKFCDGLTINGTGDQLSLKFTMSVSGTTNRTMLLDDIKVVGLINNASYSHYTTTIAEEQTLTIGSNGISSFCSEYALDFTDVEGVKAYIASSVNGTNVVLTQVDKVPASTGLLLVGEEGASADVLVIESAEAVGTNLLKPAFNGSTIPCSDGTTFRYVFGTPNGGEKGFYQLIGNNITSTGNFAYLESNVDYLAGNNARALTLSFDDDATGIQQTIVLPMDDTLYNLAGQKVAASYKGIVIKNGKKMLNK